jgi:hypothetical protein
MLANVPFAMGVSCIPPGGGKTGTGAGAGHTAGSDGGTDAGMGGRAGHRGDAGVGGSAGAGADAAAGDGAAGRDPDAGAAGTTLGGSDGASGPRDAAGSSADVAGSDGPSAGGTCAASPDTVWAPNAPPSDVFGLFAIGPGDVLGNGAQLLRWNGSAWTVFSPQPPHTGDLSAFDDRNIWIWRGASIVRWNATAWTDASISLPAGAAVMSVWAPGPNEAWLTASQPVPVGPDNVQHSQTATYHWGGTSWTATSSPLDGVLDAFGTITWSDGPNDVWGFAGARFIHWNGSAWTVTSPVAVEPSDFIETLWGISPNDIWAGGGWLGSSAKLWHFDGATWTAFPSAFSGYFTSVWGSCSSDVWAILSSTQNGEVPMWHFDGTAWSPFPISGSLSPAGPITGTGPDDVWLPSTSADLLHRTHGFCGDGIVGLGEQCDPPRVGPDGLQCASDCQLFTCGNGVVDPGEQCDPPETQGTTPCTQSCQRPTCGNGVIDPGEQCEPPNTSVCDAQCQSIPNVCGNGIVQPGETCDFVDSQYCLSCQTTTCGACFFAAVSNDERRSMEDDSDPACQTLSGAARTTCQLLLACMSRGVAACVNDALFHPLTACYCSDATCSAGADGVCAAEFDAVAGTTDTATVLGLLNDPTSLLSKVRAEADLFAQSLCGSICM